MNKSKPADINLFRKNRTRKDAHWEALQLALEDIIHDEENPIDCFAILAYLKMVLLQKHELIEPGHMQNNLQLQCDLIDAVRLITSISVEQAKSVETHIALARMKFDVSKIQVKK